MEKLYSYIKPTLLDNNMASNKVEKIYLKNYKDFDTYKQIHFVTRAKLCGIINPKVETRLLKEYATKSLEKVYNLFIGKDYDEIINKYTIIGYKGTPRKEEMRDIILNSKGEYRKFLAISVFMEFLYRFVRTGNLSIISHIDYKKIIQDNVDLIERCLIEDKYNYLETLSTKYVNTLFYLINIAKVLNINIKNNLNKKVIDYFSNSTKIDDTLVYGITHVLLGASNMYTESVPSEYYGLVERVQHVIYDDKLFNSLNIDIQMECCVLYLICTGVRKREQYFISKINPITNIIQSTDIVDDMVENSMLNEHTNTLFIMYNHLKKL